MDDTAMETTSASRLRLLDVVVLAVVLACAALLVLEVGTNLRGVLARLAWGS